MYQLKLQPKSENQDKGFSFHVSDNDMVQHLNRSVEDIFAWIENTNKFISAIQTPEEKERKKAARTMNYVVMG